LSGKFWTKRAAFMTAESADSQNELGEELRSQSDVEQSLAAGADHQAREKWVADKLRKALIPFQRLCNTERKKGYTDMICGVKWTVYRSERGFDDLFWAYWRALGEQWAEWMKGEKPRTPWMKRDAVTFWKLAHNKEKFPGRFNQLWKERGQSVLASWKRDGVPRGHFLALASGYFERGVKVITGQDRLDRALPWFRRFLNSDFANEDKAERAMAEYREKGFAPRELYSLKNAFAKWRTGEVSRKRSEARAKRGRVRSKNDKRLGARLPGSI
jgi:hypothetical protein